MLRKLLQAMVFATLAFTTFQVQAKECKKHSDCGPGEGCENGVCVKKM